MTKSAREVTEGLPSATRKAAALARLLAGRGEIVLQPGDAAPSYSVYNIYTNDNSSLYLNTDQLLGG